MPDPRPGRKHRRFWLLFLSLLPPLLVPAASASSLLLGSGTQANHLLILFAPGQILEYELRHDGGIQTGQQLLDAVIQATGGNSVTTPAYNAEGNPFAFAEQAATWNGQGLFAHFHQFSFGLFINGFASGNLSAAADGSYTSYFTYLIGGPGADFTTAPVGPTGRALADGDHDAYVLTSSFSSSGLAAWMITHGITDLGEDPDGDGMNHLFEYGLRRHPLQPDADGAVTLGRIETNGTAWISLTYRRPHDEWAVVPEGTDATYDGVSYTVETTPDLANWQSGTNHVTQTITPDETGPMVTVVARVLADSPKRFLRLKVHVP